MILRAYNLGDSGALQDPQMIGHFTSAVAQSGSDPAVKDLCDIVDYWKEL